ncbi:hypothetical protein HKX23_03190 [Sulfitobacter sp. KE29]|uniref:hypothetical protein n=1 Tax=unclassified Sulfitobacter TaxID=196795 RepID=UPI0023E0E400|nr:MULTISPECIES: hypothetical protein [unclassified Sulfitobacter]MDF3417348.1 hypothetical protein [Sulfitobacter sp. Ks38]MDF3424830.1 hypothetical protein [Sulfitobacter sp. KE29]MDF3428411.1 hypothetical protein [Sulfitobacter sp. S46]MDF3443183.1 hypothetical protein [Sulfitobacter sp. KE31]MDF3547208.1 hypothetical protein [Sulfitobacter sp. KE28]|tara:strand:- start:266 stop:499 length:234 start_codon:yes stop_codon:yes gene_type:complete
MKSPKKIDHSRVTAALEGRLDPAELSEAVDAAWEAAFTTKMSQPRAFFACRRRLGLGVGVEENDNLVYESSCLQRFR